MKSIDDLADFPFRKFGSAEGSNSIFTKKFTLCFRTYCLARWLSKAVDYEKVYQRLHIGSDAMTS